VARGVTIGVKLAGALQSAHDADVLHRDIKPDNVLLGQDGEPKLADFGIARLKAASEVTTETPTVTVGYAASELFEEDEPTNAPDLYGLGATLFALLKGHPPYIRSSAEEPKLEVIIGRMLFEPVPDLGPEFPEALNVVVKRAIAKQAADRFGSVAEFGQALQAVQHEHGLAVTAMHVVPVTELGSEPNPSRRRTRQFTLVSLLTSMFHVICLRSPGDR
jgi:serine/threonine-protein kinase PknK